MYRIHYIIRRAEFFWDTLKFRASEFKWDIELDPFQLQFQAGKCQWSQYRVLKKPRESICYVLTIAMSVDWIRKIRVFQPPSNPQCHWGSVADGFWWTLSQGRDSFWGAIRVHRQMVGILLNWLVGSDQILDFGIGSLSLLLANHVRWKICGPSSTMMEWPFSPS